MVNSQVTKCSYINPFNPSLGIDFGSLTSKLRASCPRLSIHHFTQIWAFSCVCFYPNCSISGQGKLHFNECRFLVAVTDRFAQKTAVWMSFSVLFTRLSCGDNNWLRMRCVGFHAAIFRSVFSLANSVLRGYPLSCCCCLMAPLRWLS